ncbi:TetR/AcrR family transcriptional regulator [Mycobacterium sp. MYCO198283]|uniref:TetR/AcrR family transcriptional regulator n=1 Tax=Mycobacterium sp. MYCO198283 TaxID=2883505 RepID=UPI001E4E577F|nr:TetR/AcrR family transcriptional regulator [Mycobacterium sp. MYCO198283]MCG5431166.1 TetR/AcrR family transcriptional regulator [Mycobacterium sp. MYCO198283]
MSSARTDTRRRIQDVARELFAVKGVQRTSLQDIAARLGISKPALYHHFSSREDLVRSIVQPLIDGGESFVRECESRGDVTPRKVLEGFFDYSYRNRADLVLVVSELSTIADLGLIDSMMAWRERLGRLIYGADPDLEQAARAVIALGGLQDCCLQFPDAPPEALRAAAVTGAMAALGL